MIPRGLRGRFLAAGMGAALFGLLTAMLLGAPRLADVFAYDTER